LNGKNKGWNKLGVEKWGDGSVFRGNCHNPESIGAKEDLGHMTCYDRGGGGHAVKAAKMKLLLHSGGANVIPSSKRIEKEHLAR